MFNLIHLISFPPYLSFSPISFDLFFFYLISLFFSISSLYFFFLLAVFLFLHSVRTEINMQQVSSINKIISLSLPHTHLKEGDRCPPRERSPFHPWEKLYIHLSALWWLFFWRRVCTIRNTTFLALYMLYDLLNAVPVRRHYTASRLIIMFWKI